ncbi:MAG: Crossover junction endonuclease mus81 [Pleopsidium flavum]|nr:MAG: Crossover junction endonuclease mus81 [Pleopsidium flavum]
MPTECGNPLLLEWIKEWLDVAKERNSKGVTTYKKAYDSMKACPLVFDHPSEAQQLFGLGPKLCDRLTEKLKEHCTEKGLPMPELPHKARKRPSGTEPEGAVPAKKPRKAKPYVPTLRSGAYALILALSTISEDSSSGLTKAQTIEQAQPLCDSSFTAPSDPTKFYTAWSSMKTLIEKDLVYERGRPLRKYALTDEGWGAAKRINKTTGGEDKAADAPVEPGRFTGHGSFIDLGEGSEEEEVSGSRADHRPSDVVRASHNIENRSVTAGHPLGGIPRDKFGVLAAAEERNNRHSKTNTFEFLELLSSSPPRPPIAVKNPGAGSTVLADNNKESRRSNTNNIILSAKEASYSTKSDFPLFQPVHLNPGSFTVKLVLDNREIRAKTDRDYIQDELRKKGVNPIVRPLELGDALWVAKCVHPAMLSLYGEEGDEVVLDWIVERKRLDDLVGSIKDGRFHEQKFRLRKSGIKNVVYLVEDISMSHETTTKYQEAMDSAIASTQVVNGYFVKKTQKLDDTIRYLARMTMMLKSLYESKALNIIPTRTLTPQTYLPLLSHLRTTQPLTSYQITYSAFASLASKSETLTLRDIFLKMLMCTRGITGDKALEIQKHWKTPREFVEAFERCETERLRKELLLEKMGGLVGRKKVGKALSAKVADVWAVV